MRKFISLLLIPAIVVVLFVGCSTPNNEHQTTSNNADSRLKVTLDVPGITMEIRKINIRKELYSLELNTNFDSNIYTDVIFVASPEDASRCYLKHNISGQTITGIGGGSNLIFDGVEDSISEYTLHLEIPILIKTVGEHPIRIPLKDSDNIPNALIKLPFDNFIKVESAKIRHDFDFLSEHCVDIAFTTSEQISDINMRVNKSKVNTGAGIGPLTQTSEHSFVYSHPINKDETEIEIAFEATVETVYNFNRDIEL